MFPYVIISYKLLTRWREEILEQSNCLAAFVWDCEFPLLLYEMYNGLWNSYVRFFEVGKLSNLCWGKTAHRCHVGSSRTYFFSFVILCFHYQVDLPQCPDFQPWQSLFFCIYKQGGIDLFSFFFCLGFFFSFPGKTLYIYCFH